MIGLLKMVYEESYMDRYEWSQLRVYELHSREDIVDFYKKHKAVITDSVFGGIKFMLSDNIIDLPIFKLDMAGKMARISIQRDNIDKLLKECIKNYEEIEEYEKCSAANKLIGDKPYLLSDEELDNIIK